MHVVEIKVHQKNVFDYFIEWKKNQCDDLVWDNKKKTGVSQFIFIFKSFSDKKMVKFGCYQTFSLSVMKKLPCCLVQPPDSHDVHFSK